jgi:hypothetical protein
MPTLPPDARGRRIQQTADRLTESLARLVLSLAPGGATLAEAVRFARARAMMPTPLRHSAQRP